MNWIDYVILAVVAVSTIVGLWRGFTRELFSLATWVGAFIAAWLFGATLAAHLDSLGVHITDPSLRRYAAYLAIFLVVLVVGTVVSAILSHWVRSSVLAGLDHSMGALVGLARGAFVVVLLVMVVGIRGDLNAPVWRTSTLVPKLSPLAAALRTSVPGNWIAPLQPARPAPSTPVLSTGT
ncbi:MAG TPA: CvpA family protein [Nevskiaceae bacterium]